MRAGGFLGWVVACGAADIIQMCFRAVAAAVVAAAVKAAKIISDGHC